jgi:hypothetical protein
VSRQRTVGSKRVVVRFLLPVKEEIKGKAGE